MFKDVSISRCESYDPQAVKDALLAALAPINGLDWVTPGMNIAIKANLMMLVKPEQAASVHPQVAVALCELLVERGAQCCIGRQPGRAVFRGVPGADLFQHGDATGASDRS